VRQLRYVRKLVSEKKALLKLRYAETLRELPEDAEVIICSQFPPTLHHSHSQVSVSSTGSDIRSRLQHALLPEQSPLVLPEQRISARPPPSQAAVGEKKVNERANERTAFTTGKINTADHHGGINIGGGMIGSLLQQNYGRR
jgi:hypothetical protein